MLKGLKNLFQGEMRNPICSAIIVAAGNGKRMESDTKKQFLNLFGRPVLAHTIENISNNDLINEIIIVVSREDVLTVKDIVLSSDTKKVKDIIVGGENRADSVSKGLKSVSEEAEIVLIHDGVRPLVSSELILNCILDAQEFGAATLGVKVKDTIKTVDKDGFIASTLKREQLVAIQTPQCFKTSIIKKAYENYDSSAYDDCILVEALGIKIKVTEGSYENIKLTTKEDLLILNALVENGEDE
jgi:2-C-methyl-D-erythritol 4-phosphate cytidylyltransferase